jgi:phosphatidylglycerophosphatase A
MIRLYSKWLLATLLGVGYFPFAPASVGALLVACVYWIAFPENPSDLAHYIMLALVAVLVPLGAIAARSVEAIKGKDSRIIVCDEAAGFLISVLFLPKTVGFVILAYFLFRVFDIIKPFPGRRSERVGGGLGVMLDDVFAGIYTNLLVRIIAVISGWSFEGALF